MEIKKKPLEKGTFWEEVNIYLKLCLLKPSLILKTYMFPNPL